MKREYSRIFKLEYVVNLGMRQWQSKGHEDGLRTIYTPDSSSRMVPKDGHFRFKCREVTRIVVNGIQIIFLDLYEEIILRPNENGFVKGSLSSEKEVRKILNQSTGVIGSPRSKKTKKNGKAA